MKHIWKRISAMQHGRKDLTTKKSPEKLTVPSPDPEGGDLPTFPDSVYAALPAFLQKVVARCDSREDRDMMLLGSLVVLGSCLLKVHGMYGGKKVFPSLFLFITAQASAGKGNLVHCRQLVSPIHDALLERSGKLKQEYETGMQEFNVLKWKELGLQKPVKPPELMLIIPANNSATGFFQLLYENEGSGLLFETEGDTLANAFRANYSNFSDGFRKGFQHEVISFFRRTEREFKEIKQPRISGVFSGTPHQVLSLIPDAENGLLSRIVFYHMNMRTGWKDMLSDSYNGMEEYFDALGREFHSFFKALEKHPQIEFHLTPNQREQFNAFFSQVQEKYLGLQGTDYIATVRRLGLIAFRMAMILTALRMIESRRLPQNLECSDTDFQTVLSTIRVLVEHSSHVFSQLPAVEKQTARPKDRKEQFLEMLPEEFTYQELMDLAKNLSIPERTAQTYIFKFCEKGLVIRELKGFYRKASLKEGRGGERGKK